MPRRSGNHSSLSQVDSLKPEYEFEVINYVLLRERYINSLKESLSKTGGKIDLQIIDSVEKIRSVSVDLVETIKVWQRTQV